MNEKNNNVSDIETTVTDNNQNDTALTNQEKPKKLPNVMRNQNFFLLFWGTVVSNVGTTLYSFAVSFYLLELTNNNAMLSGIYLAVCGIIFVVCSPFGGVLADRINKVKIIYFSDYIKGAFIFVSAFVIYFAIINGNVNLQIGVLFGLGCVNNIIGAIFSPASSALMPEIIEEEQLQQGNSYFAILSSFQAIFGIIVAGILYATMKFYILLLVVGICYILSGVSEMFIKNRYVKKDTHMTIKNIFTDMKEGLTYIKGQKAIVALMFSALFINFFLNPFFSNGFPYFIKAYIAKTDGYLFSKFVSPEMWDSIFSVANCLGSLIAGIILGSSKPKEKYGKSIKFWLIMLAGVLYGFTVPFYFLVEFGTQLNIYLICATVFSFILGYVITNVNIPINTTMLKIVEKDKLAKVMSLTTMISMGLTPIASLVGGAIVSGLGLSALFTFCTLGLTLSAVIFAFNKPMNNF